MSTTQHIRPLTRLERASVEPDNLARILAGAVKRLSYVEASNVADVAAQLNQFAMRLDRLAAEAESAKCSGCGESTDAARLSRNGLCSPCVAQWVRR